MATATAFPLAAAPRAACPTSPSSTAPSTTPRAASASRSDRDRGGFVHNLSYLNLRMTNVGCPILIYGAYMATNREYRALNNLTPDIAAGYPAAPVTAHTPIYRDITFSNITATVQCRTPRGPDLGPAGNGRHQRAAGAGSTSPPTNRSAFTTRKTCGWWIAKSSPRTA